MPTLRSRGPQRLLRPMPAARWNSLQRSTGTEPMVDYNGASTEAAVPAAKFKRSQGTCLLLEQSQSRGVGGFTLAELMVTVGVLVLLVLLFTQLLNSAA